MRRLLLFGLAGIVFTPTLPARAAQPYTETFTTGANGWIGSTTNSFLGPANGEWDFTTGVARMYFFDNGGFPVQESGTITNAPTASGGAFTGNLDSAGVSLVGFRVQMINITSSTNPPAANSAALKWSGSSSTFVRVFDIPQTGRWYTFAASLASPSLGKWNALEGSSNDFDAARQNFKCLAITVNRSFGGEQQLLIDDIFFARLPEATAISRAGETNEITWSYLRTNESYAVETADSPTGTWAAVSAFTAAGPTYISADTDAPPTRIYRVVME